MLRSLLCVAMISAASVGAEEVKLLPLQNEAEAKVVKAYYAKLAKSEDKKEAEEAKERLGLLATMKVGGSQMKLSDLVLKYRKEFNDIGAAYVEVAVIDRKLQGLEDIVSSRNLALKKLAEAKSNLVKVERALRCLGEMRPEDRDENWAKSVVRLSQQRDDRKGDVAYQRKALACANETLNDLRAPIPECDTICLKVVALLQVYENNFERMKEFDDKLDIIYDRLEALGVEEP